MLMVSKLKLCKSMIDLMPSESQFHRLACMWCMRISFQSEERETQNVFKEVKFHKARDNAQQCIIDLLAEIKSVDVQEEKLEKERSERERKLKQKQKAKDKVRSEKEKLAAEKEAAEREARERTEEQQRQQEEQSLAARYILAHFKLVHCLFLVAVLIL